MSDASSLRTSRSGAVPKYRKHKPSGQAVVTVSGRHIYLGKYGTPESREEYRRVLGQSQQSEYVVVPTPDS